MNIQKKNQEIFEKQIDLLIMYKQAHLTENVYLNEVCLNKAIKWFKILILIILYLQMINF